MALRTKRAPASRSTSAESLASRKKYDVFLSFRGIDTRRGLIAHLYDELENRRGIKTFKDDKELETGKPISPSLLIAIEESMSVIVVLSPNYASSSWCLAELTKIVQCMEEKGTKVIPIFYDVVPSAVRRQKGSLAEAFSRHEERFEQDDDNLEKVKQWRSALTKVANLSGLESDKYGSDIELVKDIVERVCNHVLPIKFEYTMSTGDFVAFEATRQAMSEVMDALKDDECTAIGVCGIGGSGKTTLVKHVGAEAQKVGLFDQVTMAVVSQSPELREIQDTLADLLGFKIEEKSDIGRAAGLKKKIMRGSRILIVLDDVWDRIDDLSTIGIPSYDELRSCNSKLLLTTRRHNVCHSMECHSSIHLDTLSEEDGWRLFMKKARKSFQESTDFYDVGRKVARECAGLPIALVAVAKALGDQDIEEWKAAALRLEMSQAPIPEANKDDVNKCIRLSYDYLRGDDAKPFFLLCCLFPEDYDIPIEEVMQYGHGIGLFQDVIDTIANARVRANSVAKHLIASSLLLDGRKKGCVLMHDVIRDTAVSIASSEGSLVKAGCKVEVWPKEVPGGCKMISLRNNWIHELPDELVCSKLQILLLQRSQFNKMIKIPETFFQRQNALRVLDISDNGIYSLPSSLSFLVNLQALKLDGCQNITDISILGKLKKLEILSMRRLRVQELPKEIGDLANLRMLDVMAGAINRVPSNVISRLSRLEELYLQCDFKLLSIAEEAGEDDEAVDQDTWSIGDEEAIEGDTSSVDDEDLANRAIDGVRSKVISRCSRLEELYLQCDFRDEEGVERDTSSIDDDEAGAEFNHSFHEFVGLKFLTVLKTNITGGADSLRQDIECYPNWVKFNICFCEKSLVRCYSWDELFSNDYSRTLTLTTTVTILPNWFVKVVTEKAEKLQYIECQGLSDILVEHDYGRLQNLKHLSLLGVACLKELMNTTAARISPNKPVFEKLEVLYVSECYPLKELCVGELPHGSLRNLKVLSVTRTSSMVSALASSNFLQRLHHLEVLMCGNLHKLEHLLGTDGIEPEQAILTNLREMILSSLPNLLEIWTGLAPHAIFSNLNFLAVSFCFKLKHLFTVAVAQCLLQLEHLWVIDCSALEGVIEPCRETEINKLVIPKFLRNSLNISHCEGCIFVIF